MDDREAFEGFVTGLEVLSKQYGVVIKSMGGVEFYGEPLGEVRYSRDPSSGNLIPEDVVRIGSPPMFTEEHCLDSADLHYEDRLLVLKGENLTPRYRMPDYQLVLAERGFGCSPTARGRFVQGVFLKDGETAGFNREEFIGVIKDEHIPDWARESLSQAKQDTQNSGLSLT